MQNFLLMKKSNPRSKNNPSSKSTCLRMDEIILRKRNLIFFERMLLKVAKVYFHKIHFGAKVFNSTTQRLLLFDLNYAQLPYSSWAIGRFIVSSSMITYIGFEKDEQRLATEQPVDWTDILFNEVYFINEHRIFMNIDLIISFFLFYTFKIHVTNAHTRISLKYAPNNDCQISIFRIYSTTQDQNANPWLKYYRIFHLIVTILLFVHE